MQGIQEIDCQNKSYDGLVGSTVNDRYKIVKALSQGSNGQIYMIDDMIEN